MIPMSMQSAQMNAQASQQRALKEMEEFKNFLEGKIEPPNTMLKYFLDRRAACDAAVQEKAQELMAARQSVQQLEVEVVKLQGAATHVLDDLQSWWRRHKEEADKPPHTEEIEDVRRDESEVVQGN